MAVHGRPRQPAHLVFPVPHPPLRHDRARSRDVLYLLLGSAQKERPAAGGVRRHFHPRPFQIPAVDGRRAVHAHPGRRAVRTPSGIGRPVRRPPRIMEVPQVQRHARAVASQPGNTVHRKPGLHGDPLLRLGDELQWAVQLPLAHLESGMPLQHRPRACRSVGTAPALVSAGAPVPPRPVARAAALGSAVRRAADGSVGTCPGTSLDPRRDQPPHHGRHPSGRRQRGPAHQAASVCRPHIGEPAVRRPRRIQRVLRDRPHRPGRHRSARPRAAPQRFRQAAGICPAASISAQSASPGCARRCVIG